ncbi:hypothetical protein A946_11690 [Methylacidiphilum kamchatkense Kam1]|uniref:Uncharacterized protein n=1 Tax=Methylacidiphilum kamchatkense Kam1 TaxID=1202785 RepID=A0A0C1RI70_9BACT|nr:hypothetical protein [Methylacidiphilum kamchatkense]KIE57722.1 hypothetical protein A946_11690 [Methylacidiphilum kamchatkense Kam1]QDQ41517.1 hypothetical protein kam1_262 [Methylacidiphilum kamchatkense Kam1]
MEYYTGNRKFSKKLYRTVLLLAAGLWLSLGQKGWAIPMPSALPGNGQVVTGTVSSYAITGTNTATLTVNNSK